MVRSREVAESSIHAISGEGAGNNEALSAKGDFQRPPNPMTDETTLADRYGAGVDAARPRAFIGMETSGQLRRRFRAKGWWAVSCDLLPQEDEPGLGVGEHFQDDVFAFLDRCKRTGYWFDVAVFHPDCTYLTNSAEWAYKDPDYDRYPGVGYHQRVMPGTLVGAPRRAAPPVPTPWRSSKSS